ncbi:MAG: class I SAM-dependent methyltransferase [Fibrobacterota bacterium]
MKSLFDLLFVRDKHVCPWCCCFTFDNIFRRLVQDPMKIMGAYIKPGDTILDIGPGQGYFSIPMARMAGETGRVIAVDIQKKMLDALIARAGKAGLAERISPKLVTGTEYGLKSEVDFALAFWMVHEVPDKNALLQSIHTAMKDKALFLIAEPLLHVTNRMMEETIAVAQTVGFKVEDRPKIFFSRGVLLRK